MLIQFQTLFADRKFDSTRVVKQEEQPVTILDNHCQLACNCTSVAPLNLLHRIEYKNKETADRRKITVERSLTELDVGQGVATFNGPHDLHSQTSIPRLHVNMNGKTCLGIIPELERRGCQGSIKIRTIKSTTLTYPIGPPNDETIAKRVGYGFQTLMTECEFESSENTRQINDSDSINSACASPDHKKTLAKRKAGKRKHEGTWV